MCGDVGNNFDASRFLMKSRSLGVTRVTSRSLGLGRVRTTDSEGGTPRERFGW